MINFKRLFLFFVLTILTIPSFTFAVPLYIPGETLNPTCFPTDPDCTVSTSTSLVFPTFTYGSSTYALFSSSSQWTTNGSDIFYNAGNVGIGTSTPGGKLEISGNYLVLSNGDYGTPAGIRFRSSGGALDAGIYEANDNSLYLNFGLSDSLKYKNYTGNVIQILDNSGTLSLANSGGLRALGTDSVQALQIKTYSGAPFVNFDSTNQRVGIGTITPDNLLQVYDLVDFNNADFSTKLGYQAGKNSLAGAMFNTSVGYQALFLNTTGSANTAEGANALYYNTTGNVNTAQGLGALYVNTTGSFNSANGSGALGANTTGINNSSFGATSLFQNTTGSNNSSLGYGALINVSPTAVAITSFSDYSGTVPGTVLVNSTGHGRTTGDTVIISGTTDNAISSPDTRYDGTYTITKVDNDSFYFTHSFVGDITTGWWTLQGQEGSNNTAIGYMSGQGIAWGSGNTIIGANVGGLDASTTNNIILANGTGAIMARNDGTNWNLSGNVGIGTSSPVAKLDVHQGLTISYPSPGQATGSIHISPYLNGTGGSSAITFGSPDYNNGETAEAGIYVQGDGAFGTKMYFGTSQNYAAGSQVQMMINNNGTIGIGTGSDNPGAKLEIKNHFSSGIDSLRINSSDSSEFWMGIQPYVVGGGNVGYKFRTNNAGGVTDNVLDITGDGKIGIGIANPTTNLQVQGGLRLTGNFFDSINSTGTAGMVLKSTGTSTLWGATSLLADTSGLTKITTEATTSDNAIRFYNPTGRDDLTPPMTSNTVPSGIVTCNSIRGASEDCFEAFDNDLSTQWHNNGPEVAPYFIQYQFPSGQMINKYSLQTNGSFSYAWWTNWSLQGSNNGSTWTVLDTRSGVDAIVDANKHTFRFTNNTSYTYYKFVINNTTGDSYVAASEIELGTDEVMTLANGMLGIGSSSPTSALTVYGDTYINGSTYLTGFGTSTTLNPVMTSNTSNGTSTCNTEFFGGYECYKAFDDNLGTFWNSDVGTAPFWIQYEFVNPQIVNRYVIKPRINAFSGWIDWTLQGSNDGVNFVLLDTQSGQNLANNDWHTYTFPNGISYKYYKILITSTDSAITASATEIKFQWVNSALAVVGDSYTFGTNIFSNFMATATSGNSYILSKLGIGTTTPTEKLTVIGNGLFEGNINIATTSAELRLTDGNSTWLTRTAIDDEANLFNTISYINTGTYTTEIFTSSGSVTIPVGVTNVQVLVVAGGGGGGGGWQGGGGGAGGLISSSSFPVSPGVYSVTVGNGGTGEINGSLPTNGGNSTFSTLVAIGGGFGAGEPNYGPTSGGSGGAGSHGGTLTGANGTSGQGNNGGNGISDGTFSVYAGGGGGGAGGVGANAASSTTSAGNGGPGITSSISGSSVCYAGGGGGSIRSGTQGTSTCGGGAGGQPDGNNGVANTGGGGGSGSGNGGPSTAGNGGSGIIIIKYLNTGSALHVASLINSKDSLIPGEFGINTFGDGGGATHLDGNSLSFDIGGINKMFIDANGDLIPGSPYYGNMSSSSLGSSTARWTSVWAQNVNIGTSTWSLAQIGSSFGIFNGASATGTQALTILSNGNVGIGTSTPTEKLTIIGNGLFEGNINISTTSAELRLTDGNYTKLTRTSTNNLAVLTNQLLNYITDGTGGTITHVGGYTVHTFTSDDTFVPPTGTANVEVLVVAGGGGAGGGWQGGGGGAGGLLYDAAFAVSSTTYPVVVGSGGIGEVVQEVFPTNGATSSFSTMIASGGGRGSGEYFTGNTPLLGGSGGGGSHGPGPVAGAHGIPGQGNNGGDGFTGSPYNGGGGGGAGGVGANSNSINGNAGNGGPGLTYDISGTSTCYAGGGGGSTRSGVQGTATCGGGDAGVSGLSNTGGGGGAGYGVGSIPAGDGGSGIVIIRYPSSQVIQNASLITSMDSSVVGEYGINTFGDYRGATHLDGNSLSFDIGGINKMFVDANGNVGIGTSTPTANLTASGTIRFTSLTGAGANLQVDTLGNVTVSSDERLKDIQNNYERGLTDVMKLNPIQYKWKPETGYDTTNVYTGFSAQNVLTAIPEAVATSSNGYLSLADRPIIAALVNSIKQIGSVITNIGNGIAYLKNIVIETLTIGSSDKPTGVTMYSKNGNAFCIKVDDNGVLQSESGKCIDIISTSTSQTATSFLSLPEISTTTDTIPTSIDTILSTTTEEVSTTTDTIIDILTDPATSTTDVASTTEDIPIIEPDLPVIPEIVSEPIIIDLATSTTP